jgi:hypothetical protein
MQSGEFAGQGGADKVRHLYGGTFNGGRYRDYVPSSQAGRSTAEVRTTQCPTSPAVPSRVAPATTPWER